MEADKSENKEREEENCDGNGENGHLYSNGLRREDKGQISEGTAQSDQGKNKISFSWLLSIALFSSSHVLSVNMGIYSNKKKNCQVAYYL